MKDKISVIIPVYNVEDYLCKCVDCIISQTYENLEIILVDDGSTDKSSRLCDNLLRRDSRIRVLHKKNGGLSDARNYGIEIATGKYITFVDSDDTVSVNYIETLYELIIKYNADISICNCVHCYEGENIEFKEADYAVAFEPEKAISNMLYQKLFLVAAWAKLYKIEFFYDIKFPVGKLYEDSAIMYQIFEKAKVIAFSNAGIYGYFHREGSITTQKFNEKNFDILDISKEIFEHYKNNPEIKNAAISYYVVAALRIYLNCPSDPRYSDRINEAKHIINSNWKIVLRDKQARKKTKLGILCYLLARPFIKKIHGKVNRWS